MPIPQGLKAFGGVLFAAAVGKGVMYFWSEKGSLGGGLKTAVLPSGCEGNKWCDLNAKDLGLIKFEKFRGGWGSAYVSPPYAKVKMKWEMESIFYYYIFNGSSRDIVIYKGGNYLTLKANRTTRFKYWNGRLESLGSKKYFIPEKCELSGSCILNEEELKTIEIKFLKRFNWWKMAPEGCKVNLRIEDTNKKGYIDGKKYIFTHNCDIDKKQHQRRFRGWFYLTRGEDNIFRRDGDELVKVN